MTELMTIEEIERRYKDEWVVLIDIEADPGPVLRRARVAWHGADRDEAWAKADEVDSRHLAVWYMGDAFEEGLVPIL